MNVHGGELYHYQDVIWFTIYARRGNPVTGPLVDPATVSVSLRRPDGTLDVRSFPTGSALLEHVDTGEFKFRVVMDQAGEWEVKVSFTGTGTEGTEPWGFRVETPRIP